MKEQENSTKALILYVDDEAKNLSSFKVIFRKEYQIFTAESGQEGLDILEKEEGNIQIVISDQRMPRMNGTVFLETVARRHPDTIRILLTGYSDVQDIVEAINQARIFRYVNKPWEREYLKEIIEQGLKEYRINQENKLLMEQLEKNNQELDHFLYGAAHDLRAPVASLLGLVDLAKRENDLGAIKMILEMQTKTLTQMEELIEDVVQYSRNKYSKIEPELVDFETMLQNALDFHHQYQNAATVEKNVTLNLETPFWSDPSRIKVVLNNLVSNAIRYSDREKELSVINIMITTSQEEAIISVQDNGIGIDEEHLPRIFEMFYRASQQQKGSGLGLFLLKESVNTLKGTIEVTSTVGEGTHFIVKFPNLKTD